MLQQAIKKVINNLNHINLVLSQYQNFQLWFINAQATRTNLTLEISTTSGSENSDNIIVTTIDLPITDETALKWCYESLLLAEQQTVQKETFWKKIIQQPGPLYELESSSNLYVLTPKGLNFFNDKANALALNYYNYNILLILIAYQKINMQVSFAKTGLRNVSNLGVTIKQQLNVLNQTVYKLSLIEGTLVYQCEIDWLSQTGMYIIKSGTIIYYQQEFAIRTDMLFQLLQLITVCNTLNSQILAYYRTLLLLTHHQQLFGYDKEQDYWILTKLGKKLFCQIDYKKFIIKTEMMKVDL